MSDGKEVCCFVLSPLNETIILACQNVSGAEDFTLLAQYH